MNRVLAFFILLFCSGLALADSSSSGSNSHILNPDAVSNATDLSVNYLSQLFGTVGNTLTGNSSQMMGKLFYTLNWGIFIVAGVVIGYAVLMSTVRMASEGVTMQPGKSTLFTCLKLGIGVAMLFPSPTTGYSPLQDIVMKVVVQGVGLADSIWDSGLKYLQNGGVVFTAPNYTGTPNRYEQYMNKENTKALMGDNNSMAAHIFQSEVCMIASRDPLPNGGAAGMRPYYDYQTNQAGHLYTFPGVNDSSLAGSSCGVVSWDIKDACGVLADGTPKEGCTETQGAVNQLILALMPAAKKYYCLNNPAAKSCAGASSFPTPQAGQNRLINGMYPYMSSALLGYYSRVQIYAKDSEQPPSFLKAQFMDRAKADGWLTAGRYYWNIMQFSKYSFIQTQLAPYANSPIMNGPAKDLSVLAPDVQKTILSAAGTLPMVLALDLGGPTGFDAYVQKLYGGAGTDNVAANTTSHGILEGSAANAYSLASFSVPPLASGIHRLIGRFNNMARMFQAFGVAYKYNPITFLQKLGEQCVSATYLIWFDIGVGIAGFIAGVSWIPIIKSSIGTLATATSNWFRPILMTIATMLWAAGFFLKIFVPLYPYMIFLFAAMGWFISVIEAMVAAPLVALGLTHPENHDILGKVEQGVMLLLGVFIQPALLVIGLIAGIIMSYIAFELVVYTFSGFIMDIMSPGDLDPGSMVGPTSSIISAVRATPLGVSGSSALFIMPLILVLFCAIVYMALTQCFSLIFVLRDNVMRWIGAPSSGLASPEQLVGKVEQVGQSSAQQMGRGGGDIVSGANEAAKTISDKAEEMQQKAEDAAKSGATGGAG